MNALTMIPRKLTKFWHWGYEGQDTPEARVRSTRERVSGNTIEPRGAVGELDANGIKDGRLNDWLSGLLRQF
jgi:hypothetical protein